MPIDTMPINPGNLPVVLAGPILRRLTRTQMAVWVALRVGDAVTLHVRREGAGSTEQTATHSPVRIGTNLWLAVLTMNGIDGREFVAGQQYEYWLSSPAWPAGHGPNWSHFTYNTIFPAFAALPSTVDDLNVIHTSCRKPHGNGLDALAIADDLMASVASPRPRPHLTILSGDQIYADDVAAPLVPRIRRIAEDVIGIDESSFFAGLRSIDGRQAPTESFGLTSGAAANHLWTFGEFMAMYLLAWSDVLWPAELPAWSEVDPAADLADTSGLNENAWNELLGKLNRFKSSLSKIRRILANVPCLMIFDDHEITDDWNLDHGWVNNVYGSTEGSRILTNGLLAYLLCQHWGNKPDNFGNSTAPEAAALAAATFTGNSPDVPALRTALGIPSSIPAAPSALRDLSSPGSIRYDLTLEPADGLPLRLVLLDERTAREFPTAEGPASRISTAALDLMLPPPVSGATTVPTLVVAPAPILGVHLIEHYLQPAGALLPGGEAAVDYESWTTFGLNFEFLLDRLSAYQKVAILSGDVHYGFSKRLVYEKPPGTRVGIAAQLTGSSAKNADFLTLVLHAFGDLTQQLGIVRTRTFDGYAALTDAQRALLASPPPSGTTLPYDDIADVLLGRVFRAAQEQPVALSHEVASAYSLGAPDWQYSIEHIDDESLPAAGDDLTAVTQAAALSWTGWAPDNSYRMALGLRASNLNRIGKVFCGLPQVAWISFQATPVLSVKQELFMAVGEDPATAGTTVTVTDVPLE